jgi:glycosyltransferase involved in cell wall biosynthesis
MDVQKKVAYVGSFSFPNGGAAARRILGNAKSLREAGYNVIIGSGQMRNQTQSDINYFDGFEVHSINERNADHLPSLIKYLKYLNIGKKTVEWFDKMEVKPSVIILYGGYLPYFLRLLPWCRKHNIPLIFDAVEWYQPSTKIGYLSPVHLNYEWSMRRLSVKAKNVISISSYLDRHYTSNNCNSIIIPPSIDVKEFKPNLKISLNDKLSIAYTGNPGHKDLFNSYLEAILRIDPLGEKVVLKIAGLTNNQILKYPALSKRKYTSMPPCIESIGIVSHDNAIELVKNSDFSVLLREINRVSKAGFPTKVVESLTVGTPVICNLTSDLGKYIHDGIEGIICKNYKVESLIDAIERALKLTKDERSLMRANARKQAENSFDYRNYIVPLGEFLNKVMGGKRIDN